MAPLRKFYSLWPWPNLQGQTFQMVISRKRCATISNTTYMAKTIEIVFHRPNAWNVLLPSELPGIERVLFAKLLGVWLQADMGLKKYVEYNVHICNQRNYAIKTAGTAACAIAKCVWYHNTRSCHYDLPAWRGYTNASDINSMLQLFFESTAMAIDNNQLRCN